MTQLPRIDPKSFWDAKILGWEDSRYGDAAPGVVERIAGRISTSLRFRLEAAVTLLAPHLPGRRVVELGCGSGLLAERLMKLGAAGYQGYDISDAAVTRARQRQLGPAIRFDVAAVDALGPQGDALVFSLGLFDWLTPAEIAQVFAIGRHGHYFHAVAERRRSIDQAIHRAYVHLSYGRRTGYAPRYHSMSEIDGLLGQSGLPPARVYRDSRMRFGVFVSDLDVG